jgi:hypothetical protein
MDLPQVVGEKTAYLESETTRLASRPRNGAEGNEPALATMLVLTRLHSCPFHFGVLTTASVFSAGGTTDRLSQEKRYVANILIDRDLGPERRGYWMPRRMRLLPAKLSHFRLRLTCSCDSP